MKILFVTWDGPQTTYLEGLFLPVFKELNKYGFQFHIIQFTWSDSKVRPLREAASVEAGCSYEVIKILRKPVSLGSLATALIGGQHIRKTIKKKEIDIVLARSILPAFSALLALRGLKTKLVFDADGLPLDERVDFSGLSSSSVIYRFLRDLESQTVRYASSVLTRSATASQILWARAGAGTNINKFFSFNNGRSLDSFSPKGMLERDNVKDTLSLTKDAPLIIYVGSLGGKYLISEMLFLFSKIKKKRDDAHFLILTGSLDIVDQSVLNFPGLKSSITAMSVSSDEVAKYIAAADVGLSIIESSYSMHAVSAIKTGEYLLSGVPVIGTSGIGDSDEICSKAGFSLINTSEDNLNAAAEWFVSRVIPERETYRKMSRQIGEEYYSLSKTVCQYREAFLKAGL